MQSRKSGQVYTLTAQKCSHCCGIMSSRNNNIIIIRHGAIMLAKLNIVLLSRNQKFIY